MQTGTEPGGPGARAPGSDASELAALVDDLRRIGALDPRHVAAIRALARAPAEPVRFSYVRVDDGIALHARRTLGDAGDDGATCARVAVPAWLLDESRDAPPQITQEARRDLAELVRASFGVLEARLAEHFAFAAGNDTVLVVDDREPATLAVKPATTPSPRLRPALPTQAHGYDPAGDERQAGGARANRGTGGTGVDGTHAPDAATLPGEQVDAAPLGGAAEAIEGTLGQALVEGSPTDDDPPAASPGRMGH